MLMIEAVRSLGSAARFVSGYLHIPDDGGDGHAGAGNTHAWAQVYLPGPGWVDFDPSSGIIGNRDLVVSRWCTIRARLYRSMAPGWGFHPTTWEWTSKSSSPPTPPNRKTQTPISRHA